MFTFWFMVYIVIAFVRFDPRGNSQGKCTMESLISIVVITRYHHHTRHQVERVVLIKTSDPVLDREYYEQIISELAQKSALATRQEGVVRYDHVDAIRE
jgi:hypothetical protein